MIEYYADSARRSLWVVTKIPYLYREKFCENTLTCFAASPDSGYHIGQQVHNPKLENSNWQPLEGEILVEEILKS